MERIVNVSTIDEEFEKSRVKEHIRTRRGKMERVKEFERHPSYKKLQKINKELEHLYTSYYESGKFGGKMTGKIAKQYKSKIRKLRGEAEKFKKEIWPKETAEGLHLPTESY